MCCGQVQPSAVPRLPRKQGGCSTLAGSCFTSSHLPQAARLRGKQLKSTEPKRFELQPLNAVVPAYGRASLTVAFNPGRLERRKGFDAGAKLEDEQVTYSGQLTFDG